MSSFSSPLVSPFKRYEFEACLRKDMLGETWRALDLQDGRKMDLRLLPDWARMEEVERWTESLKDLTHPGLIPTLGLEKTDTHAAVVLESFDGETITQRRTRRPRRHFEVSEIKPWMRALQEVLFYLHGKGIAHGAIHLGNCMVEAGTLRLTDLAVSRLLRPQAHFDGAGILPPGSMSPQALDGQPPSPADDIYALGTLAYDLLTGAPVFSSGDIASQVRGTIPPTIERRREQLQLAAAPMPQAWEEWIAAALDKDPQRRPSLDVLENLLSVGSYVPPTSTVSVAVPGAAEVQVTIRNEASPPQSQVPRPSRMRSMIIAGGVAAALIAAAAYYFLSFAPKREFENSLNADFGTTMAVDHANHADNQLVIDQWGSFEKKWATDVATKYPEFQTLLNTASQHRQEREAAKKLAETQAKEDEEERLRQYVARAKGEFQAAKAGASVPATSAAGRAPIVEAWRKFIQTYDHDFEGKPVAGISSDLAAAKSELETLEKEDGDEKLQMTLALDSLDTQLAVLRPAVTDAKVSSLVRAAKIQDFLNSLNQLPRAVATLPRINDARAEMQTLLAFLKADVEAQAAKGPLPLDQLFSDGPAAEYSEGGRKLALQAAQRALKEQNYYSGEPDGKTGQATHEAILAAQKAKGLMASGMLDGKTLAALGVTGLTDDALAGTPNGTPGEVAKAPGAQQGAPSKPRPRKKAAPEPGFFGKVKRFFTKEKD